MSRAASYRKIAQMYRHNPEEVAEFAEEVEVAPRRGGGRGDNALNTHYRNFARQYAMATGQIKKNPDDFGDDY
jgi:hypothetical protein